VAHYLVLTKLAGAAAADAAPAANAQPAAAAPDQAPASNTPGACALLLWHDPCGCQVMRT
jgi:hypothetical protein